MRFLFRALALSIALTGASCDSKCGKCDSGGDSGPDHCADGTYDGPTTIQEATVQCVGDDSRFYARTEGWTADGLVFSQETANPEPQWADEHELRSFEFEPCGFGDELEEILSGGAGTGDWIPGVSSVFTCADHHDSPEAVMTYAFFVWDPEGNPADCLAFGHDPQGMATAVYDRVSDPSFDVATCSQGATTQ